MAVNYMTDFDFSKLKHYHLDGAVLPSPDQYIGDLSVIEGYIEFTFKQRLSINYLKDQYTISKSEIDLKPCLFIILESPHRFEYNQDGLPIGLAMGKTGDNLCALFDGVLAQSSLYIKDGNYQVILGNAVQYQTSCGLNPLDRTRRDMNWIDIFDNYGGLEDLKKRLFALKPRYSINLCSGGRKVGGLRDKVNQALQSFGLNKHQHFTDGNHPASWRYHGSTQNAIIF